MTYEIATVLCGGPGAQLPLSPGDQVRVADNRANEFSPCEAYQKLLLDSPADVILYSHDDVTIHDPDWLTRVMELFDNPQCVAVGLGGATGLGNRDLYRKPFNIWNMARSGYASNQTDAEVHGRRLDGVRQVAVLDAFFMAVRTSWLRSRGGWPVGRITHHCLDLWLACEAARDGKEIWITGASVTHHGGGSSVSKKYTNAPWLQGGSREQDHILPHKWLFDEYRNVLPLASDNV